MSKFYVSFYFLMFLASASVTTANAQNVSLVLEVADELYAAKNFYGSIIYYKKALDIDSSNAEFLYKYGRNLAAINNHDKASRYLKKAALFDKNNQIEGLDYQVAEAYRSAGEYRKARRYYNTALRPYRRDKNSYWYKRIDISKDAASWAGKQKETSAKPNNLGKVVNSEYAEFAPTINNGMLYFSAMIADSAKENNRIEDKDFYSRIYWKDLANNKKAQEILIEKSSLKQIAPFHHANPSVLGNQLYFSVCDTNFKCEIWKGKLENNQLSKIEKLNSNINFPSANNTQPQVIKENGFTSYENDIDIVE